MNKLLSIKEASEFLGVSASTLRSHKNKKLFRRDKKGCRC
jgi:DNA-binding transcriptional MerR regulator